MKKIIGFLEQKVQWLVFGAGAVFALYMAWIYLIQPPITVPVGNLGTLKPGEVDQRIDESLAQQLEQRMQDTRTPQNVPVVPDYAASFTTAMSYGGKPAPGYQDANWLILHGAPAMRNQPSAAADPAMAIGGGQQPALPAGAPGGAPVMPIKPVPGAGPVANNAPVSRLPVPAAPTITAMRTGLTNVIPTVLVGRQVPPDAPSGVDKCWVTVRFEIDSAALAREWQDTKLPPGHSTTDFIQVILKRQQMQSDGSWGKETVVQALPALKLMAFPSDSAPVKERWDYLGWAQTHTKDILQPDFYTKVKGDEWAIPGEELVVTAAPKPQFDATPYVDMTPEEWTKASVNLTPENRRIVSQKRQEKASENTRGRGGRGRGPAPRPSPRGAPPPELAPFDPDRPVNFQPVEEDENKAAQAAEASAGGINIGNVSGAGKFMIPTGLYEPILWGKKSKQPIVGWAHDDSAQPGGTYRYSVSYKMKNPVFVAQTSVVQNVALSEPFFVASKESEWSAPVDVASTITFYIASSPKGSSVAMQVFRWKGGEPRTKTFQVVVGDLIGATDGEVDYATGWTVVDFRTEGSREDFVLLMDPFGNLRRRDVKTDAADPKYLKLKEQAAALPAAAAVQ